MPVGVRQVAREKGLFEIIFYPFEEANGTLELQVGATWTKTFSVAPRAVFKVGDRADLISLAPFIELFSWSLLTCILSILLQPSSNIEESKRLIIFAPVACFLLGLIIAVTINRIKMSYKLWKQKAEDDAQKTAQDAAENQDEKVDIDETCKTDENAADVDETPEDKQKKPENILDRLRKLQFLTNQEAQGIKKQLGNENEVVLGAFDFYCEKKKDEKEKKKRKGEGEGEEDTSCDAVLAHQLKLILSEEQKKDK